MASGGDAGPDAGRELQLRVLEDLISMLSAASPGARLLELDGGVAAAIVPATPGRSLPNSVVYRDGSALAGALDELAGAYAAARIEAWTVWAPEDDARAIEALESAGHVLDGSPLAMLLDLAELGPVDLGDLEWDRDGELEELGAVNDLSYAPHPSGGFAPALGGRPSSTAVTVYRAFAGGETASVLATIDHDGPPGAAGADCGVHFVATPARFRRRGLSTRLLRAALADARERGCATSSLQASEAGAPIYRAIGYRPLFRFGMYERRGPAG